MPHPCPSRLLSATLETASSSRRSTYREGLVELRDSHSVRALESNTPTPRVLHARCSFLLTSPAVPSLVGVDPEIRFLSEGWLGGKGPFGGAVVGRADLGEEPSLVRLEEVMVVAQQGEVVQLRGSTIGEWDHVVDFEAR